MIFNLTSFTNYNLNDFFSIGIIGFILIFAIAIDLIFGELPTKIHPVVIIGKFIDYFTKYFIKIKSKFSGLYLTLSVTILSLSIAIIIFLTLTINFYIFIIASILILSSMFSFKLLLSSANDIKNDLSIDINKARKSVSYLVSRKTNELSEKLIISATIETLTENITDSCVSVFFYYLATGIITLFLTLTVSYFFNYTNFNNYNYYNNIIIFINFINNYLFYLIAIVSILAAIFYRILNTLDAMVAYKNQKYMLIGYFPAKLDDLLNYIPSRFSGLMVIISAFLLNLNWRNSYFIFKRDAKNCPSPNSGYTMSAAAGALEIQLKKEDVYTLGDENQELMIDHIDKAIKLSRISILLSVIVLLGIYYLILYFLLVV
ncbi:MAG: cobalamin biosynthesis protein [Methanobrevibacter sp.]|nr:cobalamin biosynthesis protein [Methanobrevibacter sp.]